MKYNREVLKLNKNNGFTLIELLVSLAIVGIIAAISLFGTQGVREQARDAKRKSDLESMRSALEAYKSDCNDYPPSSELTGGTTMNGDGTPSSCLGTNIYMQVVPDDPSSGRDYSFVPLPNATNRNSYVLCANLEQNPTTPNNANCPAGGCGGAGCDYRVVSP